MKVKNHNSNQIASGCVEYGNVCVYKGRYLMAIDIDREKVLEMNYSNVEELYDPDFYVDLETGITTALDASWNVTPCPNAFLGFEG